MSPELISILVLVVMFVIATVLPIDIGVLAFVAAFVVGTTVAGMSTDDILAGFPGDLAVTLIGVTFLFAMARNNGTIDWLVRLSIWVARGRIAVIPWLMFVIAGVLTAFGAVSPAAVAIIAPIALGLAYRHQISPLLMGLFVVHGAQAGGFSTISVYGTITNGVVAESGLPSSPLTLFLASLLTNLAAAVVVFVLFGGLRLRGRRVAAGTAEPVEERAGAPVPAAPVPAASTATTDRTTTPGAGSPSQGAPGAEPAGAEEPRAAEPSGAERSAAAAAPTETPPADERRGAPDGGDAGEGSLRATPYQWLTLVGLVGLAVATLVFELHVGLVALTVGLVIALVAPRAQAKAVAQISWTVVLLIAGVLTYVGVLQEMGTVDYVSEAVAGLAAPLLVALLLCYVGGVVSAFASSTALLGAIIPLAVPFLQAGELGAVGVIAALAVSTTVVDVSPFSTNGALVLANAREEGKEAFYRRLLAFGAAVVVVAPLAVWLVLVVPGWL